MALGDVTSINPDAIAIEVLAAAAAVNGAPSGAAGIDANALHAFGKQPDVVRVAVKTTQGQGTMTCKARLWHRLGSALGWFVTKYLNAGSSIAETGSDTIGYSEEVDAVAGADRYYLELVDVQGTAAAKAELDLSTLAAHRMDSVIRWKANGIAGNAGTIRAVADGAGVGSLTLVGSAYTFHFADGVTTNANFDTLVTASANLEVKTPGTGATVLASATDTFLATALAGGVDATTVQGFIAVSR